jgi:cell division initiation protein
MALTPVEIRHIEPKRGLLRGYKREPVDRLLTEIAESFEDVWRERADLADKVEQLELDLVRHKELEGLLRTTLVSAESAAQQLREQARKEAEGIVAEAHAEARAVARRATAEKERLDVELRRIKALLRSALETIAETDVDERPPVGEQTGEIRRLIS